MSASTNATPIIVLGGTGMLLPAVTTLLSHGESVITVCRRPERVAPHDRLTCIEGDWADAVGLVASIQRALGSGVQASRALLWVHSAYEVAVHSALDRVLTCDALVVHVCGSSSGDPRNEPVPLPYRLPRTYRQVVLGFEGPWRGPTRWLTDEEISDGALRALEPSAPSVMLVGRLDPWDEHP